jgi:Lipocalin-like domain
MRRCINVLCLSATALVLISTGVVAQQKSLKEQIQGPWSLASCNSTNEKGEKTINCASNNPRGILILAGNGNYASTTVAGGRKNADAPGVTANFGTWSVNEADKTLTLHPVGAREPAIEGKDFKMNISLNEGELRTTGDLKTLGLQGGRLDATYRRFK